MTIPIALVVVHFIADFFLQVDWMAVNKSKRMAPLLAHTAVYSSCFLPWGLEFAVVTFCTHTITDYCTSRVTRKLWETHTDITLFQSNTHWFFVVVGFDQLIHYVTLALTYRWLLGS